MLENTAVKVAKYTRHYFVLGCMMRLGVATFPVYNRTVRNGLQI